MVRLDPLYSSGEYEWETPNSTFAPLEKEFQFDLDVCASNKNAKCDKFFSKAIDGLTQPWGACRCWMNPPYGREISVWMRKAYEESIRGALVVCLVPARTDTAWWHDYAMKGEVRFLRGRQYFIRQDGKTGRAPFPCAVVVFRPGEEG